MTDVTRETQAWKTRVKAIAHGIRMRVLEHTVAQNGGYLSQACSSAEILALLYDHLMQLGPSEGQPVPAPFPGVPGAHNPDHFNGGVYNGPKAPQYDRFILSPSHYALALYAALIEVGRLGEDGLTHFNQDGSSVEMIGAEHSPGIEVSGGSFGQALAQAAGIALARKLRGESGLVWVFMSDGEFQEGQSWETLMTSAFHKLDNLRVIVDVNGQQVDGRMAETMNIEPFAQKIDAFGWQVCPVDGHDIEALADAAQSQTDRPLMVLAYTSPFQGIDILQQRGPKLHYIRFKDEAERGQYRDFLATMQTAEV